MLQKGKKERNLIYIQSKSLYFAFIINRIYTPNEQWHKTGGELPPLVDLVGGSGGNVLPGLEGFSWSWGGSDGGGGRGGSSTTTCVFSTTTSALGAGISLVMTFDSTCST